MKPASYKLLIVITLLLISIQSACILFGAPVQSPPDSEEFVEIHKVPDVLKKGEVGQFSIKTAPENICFGAIIYDMMGRSETNSIDLPELEATTEGICLWSWEVPLDAKPGTAVFRAAVEQDGIHDSISPFTFCIEKCPWGVPTTKP